MIRGEVWKTMGKIFPGIKMNTAQDGSPILESISKESGKTVPSIFDLPSSTPQSVPLAIAGSDVSVASTSSNIGEGNTFFSTARLGSGNTS